MVLIKAVLASSSRRRLSSMRSRSYGSEWFPRGQFILWILQLDLDIWILVLLL